MTADAIQDESAFAPLPGRDNRRVGVEIELGGLEAERIADITAGMLGGDVAEDGPLAWRIDGSRLGMIQIYRDTAYRGEATTFVGAQVLTMAGDMVPVEIVTEPLDRTGLARLEALCGELRSAGARGTNEAPALGYGVHFNVEADRTDVDHVWPVLAAYALVERALRRLSPIDVTRKVLPFVDTYPNALIDRLTLGQPSDLAALADIYLDAAPSRNHGLDLLPLLAHVVPDAVTPRLPEGMKVKPRPAWHYRLPDCRIDEGGWSLGWEWGRWVAVERLAADRGRLDDLARDWRREHAERLVPANWVAHTTPVIEAFLPDGQPATRRATT